MRSIPSIRSKSLLDNIATCPEEPLLHPYVWLGCTGRNTVSNSPRRPPKHSLSPRFRGCWRSWEKKDQIGRNKNRLGLQVCGETGFAPEPSWVTAGLLSGPASRYQRRARTGTFCLVGLNLARQMHHQSSHLSGSTYPDSTPRHVRSPYQCNRSGCLRTDGLGGAHARGKAPVAMHAHPEVAWLVGRRK